MSEVLSQSEIDDLLKALTSGDVDVKPDADSAEQKKKVKVHDFRRPSKFAKDQLKTLRIIYENYSRLLNNFLSGYLRSNVQIEVLSVEPLTFSEFNNSITNPAVLGIVKFSPLKGSVIMDVSPNVAFAVIDRVLGGVGQGVEKIREFTEVEMVLIERMLKNFIQSMVEPWQNIIELKPSLEKIETNAQFAQLISPNEIIALITLSIKMGDAEGMMNICIPHMVVEPVTSQLSTRLWFSNISANTSEEQKGALHTKIEKTPVPVKAILGTTDILVYDFLDLRKGDVLPLKTNVNTEVQVMVGDLLKFYARPGVRKNKLALKITQVIRGGED